MALGHFSTRGLTMLQNFPLPPALVLEIYVQILIVIASRQSLGLFSFISLQSPHQSQVRVLMSIKMLPHVVIASFVIGEDALPATFNRSGQNRAGICINPR